MAPYVLKRLAGDKENILCRTKCIGKLLAFTWFVLQKITFMCLKIICVLARGAKC